MAQRNAEAGFFAAFARTFASFAFRSGDSLVAAPSLRSGWAHFGCVARVNLYEAVSIPNHSSAHPDFFADLGSVFLRQLDLTQTNLRTEVTITRERDVLAVDLHYYP